MEINECILAHIQQECKRLSLILKADDPERSEFARRMSKALADEHRVAKLLEGVEV